MLHCTSGQRSLQARSSRDFIPASLGLAISATGCANIENQGESLSEIVFYYRHSLNINIPFISISLVNIVSYKLQGCLINVLDFKLDFKLREERPIYRTVIFDVFFVHYSIDLDKWFHPI